MRAFRLHIASEARLGGTRTNGQYRVDLPDVLAPPYGAAWQLVLEGFHSQNALAAPLLVWLGGTSHGGDSYNSFEQAPGQLIGAVGGNAVQREISASTLGYKLNSTGFLRSSTIDVRLSTLANTGAPADPGAWVMTLVVMPVPLGV